MKHIGFKDWLIKVCCREPRVYDLYYEEICKFPFTGDFIYLEEISENLRNHAKFLNHEESFEKRKYTCEEDEEWKAFIAYLRHKRGNKCEISQIDYLIAQKLSKSIFGIPESKTWINNWLTPHHIDGSVDYRCFDEDKLLILNRSIHMIQHVYDYLTSIVPPEMLTNELLFEIGCLVRDRDSVYPWRSIEERNKSKCNEL